MPLLPCPDRHFAAYAIVEILLGRQFSMLADRPSTRCAKVRVADDRRPDPTCHIKAGSRVSPVQDGVVWPGDTDFGTTRKDQCVDVPVFR